MLDLRKRCKESYGRVNHYPTAADAACSEHSRVQEPVETAIKT
jgi:hypothetical protein